VKFKIPDHWNDPTTFDNPNMKSWLRKWYRNEWGSWMAAWGRVHKAYCGMEFAERYSPKLPGHLGLYNLISDIGLKPIDGRSYDIHRIDNDKGYIVGNIKWLERSEHSILHNLGSKHTDETKLKISKSSMGRKKTPEHCAHISEVRKHIYIITFDDYPDVYVELAGAETGKAFMSGMRFLRSKSVGVPKRLKGINFKLKEKEK